MPNQLTHALRHRNMPAATAILAEMRQVMTPRQMMRHVLLAAERLAWDEGDAQVARWLLTNPAQRWYG